MRTDMIDEETKRAFAPTGTLRSTINYGNPILARLDQQTGLLSGVSVEIAKVLAAKLHLPLQLLPYESAGKAVVAVEEGEADIGFFARDPERGKAIAFTSPYVLIEGCYLVRENSPLQSVEEVDAADARITVGKGSAYDLFLSRAIKAAAIERAPTSQAVVDVFLQSGADVAAGVRQQLEADAVRIGGLRLLPGRFMVIEQAMGIPKSRGERAAAVLADFVEQIKAEGLIDAILERCGIGDVTVAPLRDA